MVIFWGYKNAPFWSKIPFAAIFLDFYPLFSLNLAKNCKKMSLIKNAINLAILIIRRAQNYPFWAQRVFLAISGFFAILAEILPVIIFSSNISITINVWIIVVLHVWVVLIILLMFSVLLLFGWFFLLINSFSSFVVFHEFPGVQWSLLVYFSDFFVVFIYLILSVPLLFHEFSFTNSRGPVVT